VFSLFVDNLLTQHPATSVQATRDSHHLTQLPTNTQESHGSVCPPVRGSITLNKVYPERPGVPGLGNVYWRSAGVGASRSLVHLALESPSSPLSFNVSTNLLPDQLPLGQTNWGPSMSTTSVITSPWSARTRTCLMPHQREYRPRLQGFVSGPDRGGCKVPSHSRLHCVPPEGIRDRDWRECFADFRLPSSTHPNHALPFAPPEFSFLMSAPPFGSHQPGCCAGDH
jgi:hypothetical protein